MDRITLTPNEKVLLKLRRHWIMLVRDTIGTALLGALPFIVIPPALSSGVLPFTVSLGAEYLSFASALWLLVVWMTLAVLWTNYYLDLWIITDHRVMSLDQIGLFNRRVTTWSMEHIQEVSTVIENPIQALLGYGTIEIETAGPDDPHSHIPGIPNPERVRAIITEHAGHLRKLEETNKKQETLLHTISHEVKGYLTKDAAALASIAEGDVGAVPETIKKIADTVVGILDSANLKNGTMQLEHTKFDLRRAVIEISEEIRPDAEHKGLTFDVLIGEGTYTLKGDEGKLRRHVFRNLIDNAVRYTKKGGVRISLATGGGQIIFWAQDSGVGITPEDMEKLFTEGGKGAHSSAVNPESTGYGLFVAKRIVEAHGGKIWAESDGAGKGATFFVELPT
jgi:signal transduction histidine kinase